MNCNNEMYLPHVLNCDIVLNWGVQAIVVNQDSRGDASQATNLLLNGNKTAVVVDALSRK